MTKNKLTRILKVSKLAQRGCMRTVYNILNNMPNNLYRLKSKQIATIIDFAYQQKCYGENEIYQELK